MKRRWFLPILGIPTLALGLSPAVTPPVQAERHPNVVLIVADDLGYGETGAQGNPEIPTPNIDSLARDGVRFTQGYVSAPVCAPTRAGMLTGRYQQRFGFETNSGPQNVADNAFGLPRTEQTLAERLKARGYATGMFGKWHLGFRPDMTPLGRGFDEFVGFHGGAHHYFPGKGAEATIYRGTERVVEPNYLTDVFGNEAASFVERHADQPFFLYLPFNAVHGPLQAPTDRKAAFSDIADPTRRTFAAMLTSMDNGIGKVLEALRRHNLDENTLIIFHSDNGGPTAHTTSGNLPLRGFKNTIYEGGIRVPYMMRWTGHLPAGEVYERPVSTLDVTPTVLAATGQKAKAKDNLDGVNLLPYLGGKNAETPHETLYWRYGKQRAIRHGDWKLLGHQGKFAQLYDLSKDIGETTNLFDAQPAVVKQLTEAWNKWDATLEEPKWIRERPNEEEDEE
jgi:arylsulfatase A-like enzyme